MYKNKKFKGLQALRNTSNQKITSLTTKLLPIDENSVPASQSQRRNPPPLKSARIEIQEIEIHHPSGTSGTRYNNDDEEDLLGSQCSVPSSQPPTQRRYLSQRGTTMISKTQSKSLSRAPNSYFEMVLMKAGADLDQPDYYILSCDHVTFVNNFRSLIKKHQDYPRNIITFIEGYKENLNNSKTELKLLTGCNISISNMETCYQSQDSMTMNFLMVDYLQKGVIDVLLEKIKICAENETNSTYDIPLLPLLLSQLKFVTTMYGELLYKEILKIYENATIRGRNDIISNAEFIFDPIHHDDFVKYLIDNATSTDDLLSTNNVKTFTNLYLSSKIQTKLRKKILLYVKEGCSITRLPIFMKFLLKLVDDEEDDLIELVLDLRGALDWPESRENDESNMEKIQVEIFTYIRQGLIRSRKLYDIWQKSIQNLQEDETKPIDLIIFLMIISIREEKSHYIENLIRRQIKLERIKFNLAAQTKKLFLPILDQYNDVFLQILYNFLKDKSTIVNEFSKNCFSIIFGISDIYQKKILNKLVELTCNKSSSEITTLALEVLKNLNNKFIRKIQSYGMLLLPMLEQISEMNLNQTRIVMELLCSIAYPLPPLSDCPTLQDHIDMMVKKQICNRNIVVKKQGIIGIVQVIDHIVRTENTQEKDIYNLNESFQTANDLPEGRGKQAANYIVRVFSSTNYCVDTLGLFYDELATVLSMKHTEDAAKVERHFLVWLCDLVTFYLQEKFEESEKSNTNCIIDLSVQKCRNLPEGNASEIEAAQFTINFSEIVLKPSADSHSSPSTLPPLFNLISALHKLRNSGSLESVNAVLGCGIMLPTFLENGSDIDVFDEYNENISKKIMDIHFHTANWYRTVISSFVTQNDELLRKKLLYRFSDLINIEEYIRNLLNKAPVNYNPPICQFNIYNSTPNFKRPVGRGKKATGSSKEKVTVNRKNDDNNAAETEGMSFLATARTQNDTIVRTSRINQNRCAKRCFAKIQFEGVYGPKEIYRQMDHDIILILREELDLTYPLPEEKFGTCIGILEFRFLMYDLVLKIESIDGVKKFTTDQPIQNMFHYTDFIEKSEIFLEQIYKNLDKIKHFLIDLLINVNGVLGNADLFTDRVNYLKVCFGLSLRFIAAFFSYSGWDDQIYLQKLKNTLKTICSEKHSSDNIADISSNVIEQLFALEGCIVDIKSAVHLYHALLALQRFVPKTNYEKKNRVLCKTFLCRKWHSFDGGMEKGAFCNILLDELIKGFLKNSNLKRIQEISKVVLTDCKSMKKKDDILKSFPNIHKGNFPMIFKHLGEALINAVNTSISGKHSEIESLKIWEESCNRLNQLLDIVQALDIPRNFCLYLKYSHIFIKIFLQHGLPSFEKSLRKNPERFNTLLKNLQYNTRFLHNLCCHSKAIKNTAIVAQIPFVRETVENLLFKVKAALAGNSCASAFWMGNLKNKDIQGDEIGTQTSSLNSLDNLNSDDEIPDDDDSSVDETILDETTSRGSVSKRTTNNQSRSDCF